MTVRDLAKMTVDQLVLYFADTAIAEEEAINEMTTDMDDPARPAGVKRAHETYDELKRIDGELRKRGRDARLALMPLYDHPNAQVNLQAAFYTLGVVPAIARERIRVIADSDWPPQFWQARSIMSALENGNLKPD